jgi:hypothetical protein
MYFEDLEYLIARLDEVKRLKFVHDAEAAPLLLLVAHFPVCRLGHVAVEVYCASAATVYSVCVRHFNTEPLCYGKLLDLCDKMVPHVQLHLFFFVSAGHDLGLFCLL